MAQTPPQFERPLLQIGSIVFLASLVIVIVSTGFHPSREDPANHPLVFTVYANSNPWISVHIGQFAGGMIVFVGGFGALYLLLVRSESSTTSALAWLGLAVTITTASAVAIVHAIDGIALKMAVDFSATAPAEEKAITFGLQKGLGGLNMVPIASFTFSKGLL
jgi:hypothetical protein